MPISHLQERCEKLNFKRGFDVKAISKSIMVAASITIIVIAGASAFYVLNNQTKSGSHNNIQQTSSPSTGPTPQNSNLLSCVIQSYTVWSVEYINDSTTTGGVSTQSSNTSYTTTTTITETVGYVTAVANNFTGTLTGAKAEWTVTACTYVTSK